MREDEPLSFNFFLNFNICSLYSVYEDEMTRFFSVTGTVEQRQVFWFINRCAESGSYALDELFTEKSGIPDRGNSATDELERAAFMESHRQGF